MIIDTVSLHGKYIRVDNPEPSESARSILYVKQAGYFTPENCPPLGGQKTDCLFLMLVLRGKGTITYEDQLHRITGGQCVFLDCTEVNRYEPDPTDPWEVIWMTIGGAASKFYYRRFTDRKFCVFVPNDIDVLEKLLNKLLEVNLERPEYYEILNAKFVTDLMTVLITDYSVIADERQNPFMQKLHAVRDYLDSHFSGPITLDALSEKFFISKFYLSREFKKEFGMTVVQYVLNKRIEKAKHLLANSTRSIEEISELCGFNDQSYFARQFKRSTGTTCLNYRRHAVKDNKGDKTNE